MDKSLAALSQAIKRIFLTFNPDQRHISFLILTGNENQGKKTFLQQSNFEHVSVDAEISTNIYYNKHGILVELGAGWLQQNKNLLEHTLKHLNRCHKNLQITGILLCVNIRTFFAADTTQLKELCKEHAQVLMRFATSLGYRVDCAIVFTQMDALAGFGEFFQSEHITELSKPLGFSLPNVSNLNQLIPAYKAQFAAMIDQLEQQVILKMHPIRSSRGRTLIREFPLQFASLQYTIYLLLQNLSLKHVNIQGLYFTSAAQGGISLDRLNQKIQHEYALAIPDQFPQSINHQAYFIDGALQNIQLQTKQPILQHAHFSPKVIGAISSIVILAGALLAHHHFKTSQLLDTASKEFILYESMVQQGNATDPTALFHLTKVSNALDKLHNYSKALTNLKQQIASETFQGMKTQFVPALLTDIESTMADPKQLPLERYQALKIYLMLGNPKVYSEQDVLDWFQNHWNNKPLEYRQKMFMLLKQTLYKYKQLPLNTQLIIDVRNYLTALPSSYLYYALAKNYFSHDKLTLNFPGFQLYSTELPVYFTKAGVQQVLNSLPKIIKSLANDQWVLNTAAGNQLQDIIEQAYFYDYATWWKNFIQNSHTIAIKDYSDARNVMQMLASSKAVENMLKLIQEHTGPDLANASKFNQYVAAEFTNFSLLSTSGLQDLNIIFQEMERFLATLAAMHDNGKTAFQVTKSIFQGATLSNPINVCYLRSQQLPVPLSTWTRQLVDEIWFMLLQDTKNYINQLWQQNIFPEYQKRIASRYPFDSSQPAEVTLEDFNYFFAQRGLLNSFVTENIKPFLDTSASIWKAKEVNGTALPIAEATLNELMRANVITNMFFATNDTSSKITFTLQKISLDPMVSKLQLSIGDAQLKDNQDSNAEVNFSWPQANAKLILHSIDGQKYELEELGLWGFFRLLQKVNVLVDEQDSANLQILFEINGNSGRYELKTTNIINPFIPGILNGLTLQDQLISMG